MWRIRTFVDEWLLSDRAPRGGSKRRSPRRVSIGKRPELEHVEERILLSTTEVAMFRAAPLEISQQAKAEVQISARVVGSQSGQGELTATLTSNGLPVVGERVVFRLGDRMIGTAKTDVNGVATLTSARLSQPRIRNALSRTTVVFRGNANLLPAAQRGLQTIDQTPPTLTSVAALSHVTASGIYGGTAGFSAVLTSDGSPAAGKPVSFILDGRTVGVAMTDFQGAVTLPGIDLTGLDAGTYGITATFAGDSKLNPVTASGSLTIAKAAVSITLDGLSQTYGGTDQVTATTLPIGRPVTLSYTDANGDPVARPVNAGTYTVAATINDANYTGDAIGTLVISPAVLTVSGLDALCKTYDGSTVTTIDASGAVLSGVIAGDSVAIDASRATANFTDSNVGTDLPVTIADLALAGPDASNYVLAQTTALTTASIIPKALTISGVTTSDKVYDGTTNAVFSLSPALGLNGVVGADDVTLISNLITASFATKSVGQDKAVTFDGFSLSGAASGNYVLTPLTATANITKASLTVLGITASDKVYDGTTAATLDGSGAMLSGLVGGDDVSIDLSGATADFADKDVGAGKAVTVTGLALIGADTDNYEVVLAPISASITPRTLNINGFTASNRTYDGTTVVSVSAVGVTFGAGDVIGSDDVSFDVSSLATANGTMADKNAGTGKAVTVGGLVITGVDAGNYTIVATTTVDISRATLTVTGIPSLNKSYDGNQYFVSINTSSAVLNGVISEDVVTLNTSGIFGVSTSANVGTWTVFINGLSLGGGDAANYNLSAVIVSGTIQGP